MTGCWSHSAYQGIWLSLGRRRRRLLQLSLDYRASGGRRSKTDSFSIDIPDGGDVLIKGCVIVQEGVPENDIMIGWGRRAFRRRPHASLPRVPEHDRKPSAVNGTFFQVNASITDRDIKDNVLYGPSLDSEPHTRRTTHVVSSIE
jgi:hypothetical protein